MERGKPAYEIIVTEEKNQKQKQKGQDQEMRGGAKKKVWNINLHPGTPQLNGSQEEKLSLDSVVAPAAALTLGTWQGAAGGFPGDICDLHQQAAVLWMIDICKLQVSL